MARQAHSDKALETLRLMNSKPEDWHIAEIEWKQEMRTVPTRVVCETCGGRGRALVNGSGEAITRAQAHERAKEAARASVERDFPTEFAAMLAYREQNGDVDYLDGYAVVSLVETRIYGRTKTENYLTENGFRETTCPTCPPKRKYPSYGTGEVIRPVRRLVWIGRILWAEGTKFKSRFGYGAARSNHQCALCAKGINKSGRVPVQGFAADGTPLGMFVGEDCARKFLDVESFKKDHFLAENIEADSEAASS